MDLATKKKQMSAKKACFQFAEVQPILCKDMIFPRNHQMF